MGNRLRNRTFLPLGIVWGCCGLVAGCATTAGPAKAPGPNQAAASSKAWVNQGGSQDANSAPTNQGAPLFRLQKPTTVNPAVVSNAVPLRPGETEPVRMVVWESTPDGQTVPRYVSPVQALNGQPMIVQGGGQGNLPILQPQPGPAPEVVADQPGMPMPKFWVNGGPHHPHAGYGAAGGGPVPPRDVPTELKKVLLPEYVVGPPDVLEINLFEQVGFIEQPVRGPHVIRPDGTVGLGLYGSARVAGLTLEQAHIEIAKVIHSKLNPEKVKLKNVIDKSSVDVLAFNSQLFFIITDGGGFGEQVFPLPVTGNETVLSAIGKISGLPPVASKKHIWVARRIPGHATGDNILQVDWCGITQRGETETNYQIMPGDRIYVQADRWITFDRTLQKVLQPIERILGITLLGSQTVNSIRAKTQ